MNARDFQTALASASKVPEETVALVLKHLPGVVLAALATGEVIVKVRGVANFRYYEQKATRITNPRTGEIVPIPAKRRLRVVPTGVLKHGAADRREAGQPAQAAPLEPSDCLALEVG